MYVEKTDWGYNIMDIEKPTLVAIEKMITAEKLDNSGIVDDSNSGCLFNLKICIMSELRNLPKPFKSK